MTVSNRAVLGKKDSAAFASLLRRCGNAEALQEGRRLHAQLARRGFDRGTYLGNLVVEMYGKCGALGEARAVFARLEPRNVFSWTILIAAHAQRGRGREAALLFEEMEAEGVVPNGVTFVSVLSACAGPSERVEGKRAHSRIVAMGLEADVFVGTALVSMYGRCGSLEDARAVFDAMPERNVVSWNAMMGAYTQQGQVKEALQLFRLMQLEGVMPDKPTFVSILSACASPAALAEGKQMHARVVACGLEADAVVGTALVNMYAKCGSLDNARSAFATIPSRDVVSWSAIIGAYALYGRGKEALELFQEMQREGVVPNTITFSSVLSACAGVAALAEGKRIHACIVASGFEADVVVGNTLINMYSKCGSLDDAKAMFDRMPQRNLISWGSIIGAYAQHGRGKAALQLFQRMQLEGMAPDKLTFVSILSACSHTGLVDQGHRWFVSMTQDYGIVPILEHYHCMIDLLGRAGWLDEAEDLITEMPYEPTAMTWMTLLAACRMHLDVKRGKCAAEHVFRLDRENAAPYVLLSNIYAAAGRWEDAAKVRKLMEENGLKKQPGYSLIAVNDKVHRFVVGDESHPQKEKIYAELQRLSGQMEEVGYVPDTKGVLHDIEEMGKEHILCHHSEKLAIAFGLISTPPGTPLHITKNLRVCPDCHSATKFISKIVHREIVVRDANRFHHFQNGVCSCGEYW